MLALLFDLDGVLWFSEKLHKAAFIKALYEEITKPEEIIEKTWNFGESTDDYLRRLAALGFIDGQNNNIDRLKKRKRDIAKSMSSNSDLLNVDLIRIIDNAHNPLVKLGLVSSSSQVNVENFLLLSKLESCFDIVVDGSKVQNPKPAPDSYIFALNQLNIPAFQAVAVEDSQIGVQAAKSAGINEVLIYPDPQLNQKVELFING